MYALSIGNHAVNDTYEIKEEEDYEADHEARELY